MKRFLNILGHLVVITILTIITQVGGIIWLIALLVAKRWRLKKRFVFPILHLVFNVIIIPPIAKAFGREQLPLVSHNVKPINWFYPLAFRNYVTPQLKSSLIKASQDLAHLGIKVTYLDANFPFLDGFPLLPHLSHNDGKKVDISFQYKTKTNTPTHKKPALFGYGVFVNNDNPTSSYCKDNGYWQYDFTKYLGIKSNPELKFDKAQTKTLIQNLLYRSTNAKLFIEPYLKHDLGLSNYNNIRFHGCQAVRHDDHIHLEIK